MSKLPIHLVACDPNGLFLAFGTGSSFNIFDVKKNELINSEHLKNNNHTSVVRTCSFHRNGDLCVTAGDDKQVKVWNTKDWSCIATRKHSKKISTVAFGAAIPNLQSKEEGKSSGDIVVVYADKFGDVYASSITNFESSTLILGHCSTVSHLIFSPKEDFIITADRDEKVRVTHYPRTFDIESFCLGHTSLVTRLVIHEEFPDLLVSGGSDGTLRLWNYRAGQLLHTLQLPTTNASVKPHVLSISASKKANRIAVVAEGLPNVLVYGINAEKNELQMEQNIAIQQEEALVLCADFDINGRLWVVGKNSAIQCFQLAADSQAYVQDSSVNAVITAVSSTQSEVNAKEYEEILKSLSYEQLRKKDHEEFVSKKQKPVEQPQQQQQSEQQQKS